ncbi:MAG: protein kinase [Parachlamydiales bacterium]
MENCPACQSAVRLPVGALPRYCPACGYYLGATEETTFLSEPPQDLEGEEELKAVGYYRVLKQIAKGGMGEVYLAYDPSCRRKIALKRIRPDLQNREVLHQRFLREAWITSQLTHPGVVPIYNIHVLEETLYYTMPYVEGQTLKALLKEARAHEGDEHQDPKHSIPSLIRIFMGICQTVAYAHSKGILHRDLKPENVMVGAYGEVYLLDWGLATWTREEEIEGEEEEERIGVTLPGKIFGTVAYMAPERACGAPATVQTDLYALGAILYEILALRPPFKRGTIKEFRQSMGEERLIYPGKLAPFRNVPRMLARIAQKALRARPEMRYGQVEEMIGDLKNYLEGRSEWFGISRLDVGKGEDWEFQENVYLADYIALTTDLTEWVSMMVSKEAFPGNVRLTARVRVGAEGQGVGLMISLPEPGEREQLNSGYLLWVGSTLMPGVTLFRSAIAVASDPEVALDRGEWVDLRLERVDSSIRFYIGDRLILSYVSHIPLRGGHVGFLSRDASFEIEPLEVFVGSYSIRMNCLEIPDAFLAAKDYERALSEYHRVAKSFPERDEGREAQFRAGITLLEKAKQAEETEPIFDAALAEFEKLHNTPGAPLEYLGKALVYRTMHDPLEEIKCFELALRRYPHHPRIGVLKEQVVYRMHESSRRDRTAAYRFMLLMAQHMPKAYEERDSRRLIANLQRHWERLPFIEPTPEEERLGLAVSLAFWLAKPHTLEELIETASLEEHPNRALIQNALFALLELGARPKEESLTLPLMAHEQNLKTALDHMGEHPLDPRALFHLMELAIDSGQAALFPQLKQAGLAHTSLNEEQTLRLQTLEIWSLLKLGELDRAGQLLAAYPLEQLSEESHPFFVPYGCLLAATEGVEVATAFFLGILEHPHPKTSALLAHYLLGNISLDDGWGKEAFLWERRQLCRQLALYHTCLGEEREAKHYQRLADKERVS